MGVMHVPNDRGHVDVAWSVEDLESLAAADAEFDRLRGQGYVAFERERGRKDALGKRLSEFDSTIEEIFWIRPVVGG